MSVRDIYFYILAAMSEKNNIEIKGVPIEIYEQLKNIANNSDVKMTTLLRTSLTQIISDYPTSLKRKDEPERLPLSVIGKRVIVRNMPDGMKKEIDIIAKKIGTTSSSLLKTHLSAIIQKYPEHMRTKD